MALLAARPSNSQGHSGEGSVGVDGGAQCVSLDPCERSVQNRLEDDRVPPGDGLPLPDHPAIEQHLVALDEIDSRLRRRARAGQWRSEPVGLAVDDLTLQLVRYQRQPFATLRCRQARPPREIVQRRRPAGGEIAPRELSQRRFTVERFPLEDAFIQQRERGAFYGNWPPRIRTCQLCGPVRVYSPPLNQLTALPRVDSGPSGRTC